MVRTISIVSFIFLLPGICYTLEPNERVYPIDGTIQIWVPAGEFIMGVDDPESPDRLDERPTHKVVIDGFWMDKYEVTNEQYVIYFNKKTKDKSLKERFQSTEIIPILNWPESGITHDPETGELKVKPGCERWPVLVTWHGAFLYCETTGKSLPSEAQWEWAARGPEGRKYPWGNRWAPKKTNVNTLKIYPIGSFPEDVSLFGIYDMAGNVREYCLDKYEVDYYLKSPIKNPLNFAGPWMPVLGRAIRGGGYSLTEWDARTTSRGFVFYLGHGICTGFRGISSDPSP